MATEYDLDLGGIDVKQVAHLIHQAAIAAGLTSNDDEAQRYGTDGALLDSGLLIVVRPVNPDPLPDPFEAVLGFSRTVGVLFRFDRETGSRQQEREMMELTSAVLTGTAADAALAFAGESVQLIRKDGKLTISDQDDFWTPEILALLPQPYERATFPML